MSITRAIREKLTDRAEITERANSAAFVYNQVKNGEACDGGAYIEDALQLVATVGNVLEKDFNFGMEGCSAAGADRLRPVAANFRIQKYASIITPEDDARTKSARVCEVINTDHPVVVGLRIGDVFWNVRPGTRVWRPDPETRTTGAHAMVVVGYDQVEKRFTLLNSFGPAWGDNGFIQLGFQDFARLCAYAYVLVPGLEATESKGGADAGAVEGARQSPANVAFGGEFVFRRPAGYLTGRDGKRVPFFEEVSTVRAGAGLYVPKVSLFAVGDVFQLVARNVPGGCHVYVFSQGSDGEIGLHFPRKTGNKRGADFMLSPRLELVIPNEETVLQLSDAGEDYLCVIYSVAPVPDLEERLARLDGSGDRLPERARLVFADILLGPDSVDYFADQMAFRARAAPVGGPSAVGLFLKITTE